MTSSHGQSVCVKCRVVTSGAIHCGHEIAYVGPKWRAPRKTNDRAWKRIEAGDWLWDHAAKVRKQRWQRRAWLAVQDTPRHLLRDWNIMRAEQRQRWEAARREEQRARLVEAGASPRKMRKKGF